MARIRAGRYPSVKDDCSLRERVRLERTPGMITPIHYNYCETHLCYVKTCETCGREFHTVRIHTRHCSTGCSQYAYRQRVKAQA